MNNKTTILARLNWVAWQKIYGKYEFGRCKLCIDCARRCAGSLWRLLGFHQAALSQNNAPSRTIVMGVEVTVPHHEVPVPIAPVPPQHPQYLDQQERWEGWASFWGSLPAASPLPSVLGGLGQGGGGGSDMSCGAPLFLGEGRREGDVTPLLTLPPFLAEEIPGYGSVPIYAPDLGSVSHNWMTVE